MLHARAFAAAMLAACLLPVGAASAQTYPDHPVTMLVAFPPGGAERRHRAHHPGRHQKALGQPSCRERGGAGGMLAAAKCGQGPRRTATPSCCIRTALAAGMTLYPDRTFDAEGDLVAIGLVNTAAAGRWRDVRPAAQNLRRIAALGEERPDRTSRSDIRASAHTAIWPAC